MPKKRIKKSRKKSYLKRASRRKSRHTYRRKDKHKIKKTKKKRLRGGAESEKVRAGEDEVRMLLNATSEGNLEEVEKLLSEKLYNLNNLLDAQEVATRNRHRSIRKKLREQHLQQLASGSNSDPEPTPDAETELEHSSEPAPSPVAEPEQLTGLTRLSSSRIVNVDDELLKDTFGIINGHGAVVQEECFVIPYGICFWAPVSTGEKLFTKRYGKFRKYGPGSLIQEHIIKTTATYGVGVNAQEKEESENSKIGSYSPSLLLTGQNSATLKGTMKPNMINLQMVRDAPGGYDSTARTKYEHSQYFININAKNRELIEELLFSDHDERIIPKSELLTEDGNRLIIQQIKLSELFKRISEAQPTTDNPQPIPTNWVGNFCRSGTALNIDFLKEKCSDALSVSLDDSDFGGVTSYEQEGESQLTHQSSLSSRRVPGNFKQIVEELYELFNRGEGNVSDEILAVMKMDLVKANAHFKNFLNEIKHSIDNIEPIHYVNVCAVLQLRKLNL